MDPVDRRSFLLFAGALGAGPIAAGVGQGSEGSGWFNVRAYGARGDGRADDATAIQRAIAAAAATGLGGVVFLPPGRYAVGQPLRVEANGIELIGSGREATQLLPLASVDAVLRIGLGDQRPAFRWGVRDLRISDPHARARRGILLDQAREGLLQDVWVREGCDLAALELAGNGAGGCWSNRFVRLTTSGGAGAGVRLGPQSNADFFEHCHFTAAAGPNVQVDHAAGVRFLACQFEGSRAGREMAVGGGRGSRVLGLTVAHCYFELRGAGARARALHVAEATGERAQVEWLTFTDNYVWGGGDAEVLIEIDAPRGRVSGVIRDNALMGATVAGCRRRGRHPDLRLEGRPVLRGFGTGPALPLIES